MIPPSISENRDQWATCQELDNTLYITIGKGTQISAPLNSYTLTLIGSSTGTFTLILAQVDGSGASSQQTVFFNIPVGPKGTAAINGTTVGPLQLDSNGDGVIDATLSPGGLSPSVAVQLLTGILKAFDLPQGTKTSLLAKLEAASSALQRGERQAASGQLGAFQNEVSAQSGKNIQTEIAVGLIEIARTIITSL